MAAATGGEGYGEIWYPGTSRCPVVALLRTAAGNMHVIDVWMLQRDAAPPPGHGLPPQPSFR